jgi:hypothetical protein
MLTSPQFSRRGVRLQQILLQELAAAQGQRNRKKPVDASE